MGKREVYGKIPFIPIQRLPPAGAPPGAHPRPGRPAGGSPPGKLRRGYLCRFVQAGLTRASGGRAGRFQLSPQALEQAAAAGLFDRRAVFLDHAAAFEHPRLRDLVGVTAAAAWNPSTQAVEGVIRLYESRAGLADLLDQLLAEGPEAPDVGLSIVFYPQYAPPADGAHGPIHAPAVIDAIRFVESVDLVFEPAAGGRLLQALSAGAGESRPQFFVNLSQPCLPPGGAQPSVSGGAFTPTDGGYDMSDFPSEPVLAAAPPDAAPEALACEPDGAPRRPPPPVEPGELTALASAALLANSGLPQASQERLAAQSLASLPLVRQAIEAERAYLARLSADQVVRLGSPALAPRGAGIQLGLDGKERLALALEALLAGRAPSQGVAPLSGIREAYLALSGDYEMTGVFHAERLQLTAVDSSTMAGLVANALNKSVVNQFQQYPRWWERFAFQEDFQTLQQVKWITLGGVGELPTVGEGAAYSELSWDDQSESASFVKKGGYLGVTLEAIDKDDTRKLQAAPRALAQAAWLTLSKAVSNIFTASSGAGPAMSDGSALFHANHANLGSSALSITAYAAARTAMRKQTELNSGERLGALTAPKYLLVPPDLEITALQVLASEHDYAYALSNAPAAPANPFAEGASAQARLAFARERVIVVDLWTDTNDWAAVADPLLYPSVGLGFRYGRTPEIFSVASPTAGLMFSNDVMPIKVRFFFAVGPTDWRGLYKANV